MKLLNNFFAIFLILTTVEISQQSEIPVKSKEIDFSLPDLITTYKEDGRVFQLQAFKSFKNSETITDENFGKQKWFSIGRPRLIESKMGKQKKSIFHKNSNGFYAYIEMLTEEQKEILAKTAQKKFNIKKIDSDQIKNLLLSYFKCTIKLFTENDTPLSEVKGNVVTFDEFPLLIEFMANNREIKEFYNHLNENEEANSVKLDCEIKAEGFIKNIILDTKKSSIRNLSDKFDCNNELWSCINGICGLDGKCKCQEGYSGDNCARCIYYKFKNK